MKRFVLPVRGIGELLVDRDDEFAQRVGAEEGRGLEPEVVALAQRADEGHLGQRAVGGGVELGNLGEQSGE